MEHPNPKYLVLPQTIFQRIIVLLHCGNGFNNRGGLGDREGLADAGAWTANPFMRIHIKRMDMRKHIS
jgi:hypothetical protein